MYAVMGRILAAYFFVAVSGRRKGGDEQSVLAVFWTYAAPWNPLSPQATPTASKQTPD